MDKETLQELADKYQGHSTLICLCIMFYICSGYFIFAIKLTIRIICILLFIMHGCGKLITGDQIKTYCRDNSLLRHKTWTEKIIYWFTVLVFAAVAVSTSVIPVIPRYIKALLLAISYWIIARKTLLRILPEKE